MFRRLHWYKLLLDCLSFELVILLVLHYIQFNPLSGFLVDFNSTAPQHYLLYILLYLIRLMCNTVHKLDYINIKYRYKGCFKYT